jgi:hypothetical protein
VLHDVLRRIPLWQRLRGVACASVSLRDAVAATLGSISCTIKTEDTQQLLLAFLRARGQHVTALELRVDLTRHPSPAVPVAEMLRACPGLQRLVLQAWCTISDIPGPRRMELPALARLTSLQLQHYNTEERLAGLAACTALRELRLTAWGGDARRNPAANVLLARGVVGGLRGLRALQLEPAGGSILAHLSRLQELQALTLVQPSEPRLAQLQRLRALTELALEGRESGERPTLTPRTLPGLSSLTALRALRVVHAFRCDPALLAGVSWLQRLELVRGYFLESTTAAGWAALAASAASLTSLTLDGVPAPGWHQLLRPGRLPQLRVLGLHDLEFGPWEWGAPHEGPDWDVVPPLAAACPGLRELALTMCEEADGLELAQLSALSALTALSVCARHFTRAEHVAGIAAALPQLRRLDIDADRGDNDVEPEEEAALLRHTQLAPLSGLTRLTHLHVLGDFFPEITLGQAAGDDDDDGGGGGGSGKLVPAQARRLLVHEQLSYVLAEIDAQEDMLDADDYYLW